MEPELDKPAFLWGGERSIGKQGFGITSGLGCWGVWEGWTEHSSGGVSWVVQTVEILAVHVLYNVCDQVAGRMTHTNTLLPS